MATRAPRSAHRSISSSMQAAADAAPAPVRQHREGGHVGLVDHQPDAGVGDQAVADAAHQVVRHAVASRAPAGRHRAARASGSWPARCRGLRGCRRRSSARCAASAEVGRPCPLPGTEGVQRIGGRSGGCRDAPWQGHIAGHERGSRRQVALRQATVEQLPAAPPARPRMPSRPSVTDPASHGRSRHPEGRPASSYRAPRPRRPSAGPRPGSPDPVPGGTSTGSDPGRPR